MNFKLYCGMHLCFYFYWTKYSFNYVIYLFIFIYSCMHDTGIYKLDFQFQRPQNHLIKFGHQTIVRKSILWVLFFHPLNIYYLRYFCPQDRQQAGLQNVDSINHKYMLRIYIYIYIYASPGQFPMCLTFKFNLYSLHNCSLLNCPLVQCLISVSYTYTLMLKNDKLCRQWLNFFNNYSSQF